MQAISRPVPNRLPLLPFFTLALTLLSCAPSRPHLRAHALLEAGDYLGAQRLLQAALERKPDDDGAAGFMMRAAFARGEPRAALTLYNAHPSATRLRHLLAARLWSAMRHVDNDIRLAAIQVARRLQATVVAKEMVARLSDPAPAVRTWAAVALSGSPAAANLLERQIESPSASAVAIAAREFLRLGGAKAVSKVAKLVEDNDPRVRRALAVGLGYADAASAGKLLQRLANDANPNVRVAAYSAIAKLKPMIGPALLARASMRKTNDRRAALTAYATLVGPKSGKPLVRRFTTLDDLGFALLAGRILAKWGEPQPVLNSIAQALRHAKSALRIAAINCASGVSDVVAYGLARDGLGDPDPRVRAAAVALALSKNADRLRARGVASELVAHSCPIHEALCLEASRLSALAGVARGRQELQRLALNATQWGTRAMALRHLWREEKQARAHLRALADINPRVALVSVANLWQD